MVRIMDDWPVGP